MVPLLCATVQVGKKNNVALVRFFVQPFWCKEESLRSATDSATTE